MHVHVNTFSVYTLKVLINISVFFFHFFKIIIIFL